MGDKSDEVTTREAVVRRRYLSDETWTLYSGATIRWQEWVLVRPMSHVGPRWISEWEFDRRLPPWGKK